ncbi:MAG: hydroxysqualene dehydroxylase HpnE [Proteobacteria bacterium]|nr:hydroxysqualene dehydroxylase HpnE [Pseudomonadota bacterium]
MTEPDAIVIGGGIAGLACALALGDAGLRVTLLEQSDSLGGRARSCTAAETGDRIDLGPHIMLTEYRNMLRLLGQLGTRDRVVWQQQQLLTLVGRPHPVTVRVHRLPAPLHLLPSLLGVPQVSLRDLASNARLFWRVARLGRADALRLDDTSAEDCLRAMGVSERFIEWFWRSAAMTVMNVPLERCSAGALLGFFRYLIGTSGFQVGFAGEGLGDLFAPPALRRIETVGGSVRLHTRVVRLTGTDRAACGVRLADGSELRARWCVAAVPPSCLAPLLPESWAARHAMIGDLASFAPSPYISSYLWFDRKLTRERFWSKVWSPDTLNYDFYDLSNIRPGWSERGSVIASNIIHSQRAEHLSDEQIVAATVRELAEFVPEAEQARVVHARVHRIPMAIPAPYPGSEQRRPATTTPIEGLLLAGDWVRTGLPASMESAVRAGWLAAEQVLAAANRPRQLVCPLPPMQGLVRLVGGRAAR